MIWSLVAFTVVGLRSPRFFVVNDPGESSLSF